MSNSEKLKNCDNNYTVDELFNIFGMSDEDIKVCLKCTNHRMEGGIITCKHILDRIGGDDE